MTETEFYTQVKRLQTQWPNSYGTERVKLLWDTYWKEPVGRFENAITYCLVSCRAAPLASEIESALDATKSAELQSKLYDGFGKASTESILADAARANKTADSEFVKECTKLLRDKLNGKITHAQFLEGCGWLDTAAKNYNASNRNVLDKGRL